MGSVNVKIATVLRKHTGGDSVVAASGDNVGAALADVSSKHPEFGERIVDAEGNLHRFVNVYLNDEDIRYLETLATPINDGDEISILPAVAGGA